MHSVSIKSEILASPMTWDDSTDLGILGALVHVALCDVPWMPDHNARITATHCFAPTTCRIRTSNWSLWMSHDHPQPIDSAPAELMLSKR